MDYSQMSLPTITPSIIPNSLKGKKLHNSGDLYIQELIKNYIFDYKVDIKSFSFWDSFDHDHVFNLVDILKKSSQSPLLVAGTNCLNDNFSLTKNVDPKAFIDILQDRFIALSFVGLLGSAPFDQKHDFNFSEDSTNLLSTILQNGVIAARCRTTHKSLINKFPRFADKIFLTGCISAAPQINCYKNFQVNSVSKLNVLFSFTSRNGSEMAESKDLEHLISSFGSSSISVIINQDRIGSCLKSVIFKNKLKVFNAKSMNVTQYYQFLAQFDLHVGSRAHVHIPLFSLGIRSFLTGFEQRHSCFQDHYECSHYKIGTVFQMSPLTLLYDDCFDKVKKRLTTDAAQRNKYKTYLLNHIHVRPTTYNIAGKSQWLVRQEKAYNLVCDLNLKSITELGPGFAALADKLISSQIDYRGYDIISRRKFIKEYDINSQPSIAPRHSHDALLLLGVLEYVNDPLAFIQQWVSRYKTCIFTYNTLSSFFSQDLYAHVVSQDIRSSLGWKNSLTLNQLKALLVANGVRINYISETKYPEYNRLYCEYIFAVES